MGSHFPMAYGAIAIPERLPAPRAVRATATMVAALAIGALVAIVLMGASAPRDDTALVQLHGRSGNWKLKMGAALRKHVRMQAAFKPTKTKAHTKLEVHRTSWLRKIRKRCVLTSKSTMTTSTRTTSITLFQRAHRETTRFFEIFDDGHAQPHITRFTYRRASRKKNQRSPHEPERDRE